MISKEETAQQQQEQHQHQHQHERADETARHRRRALTSSQHKSKASSETGRSIKPSVVSYGLSNTEVSHLWFLRQLMACWLMLWSCFIHRSNTSYPIDNSTQDYLIYMYSTSTRIRCVTDVSDTLYSSTVVRITNCYVLLVEPTTNCRHTGPPLFSTVTTTAVQHGMQPLLVFVSTVKCY